MAILRERKVTSYPPLPIVEQLRAYADLNDVSDSAVVTQALKGFFEKLSPEQKIKIVNATKQIKTQGKTVSKNSY